MDASSRRSRTCEEMVRALKLAGCRLTRQRKAIIDYLAGRDDHPSARQIFHAVSKKEQGTTLATVYNTLATLVENGLIQEMDFEHTDNRYDTNVTPHLNLVCTTCGQITDVQQQLPASIDEIKSLTGFETRDVRLEYRGICHRCGKGGSASSSSDPERRRSDEV